MYGFIVLLFLVVPRSYDLGGTTGVYGVGVGVLAHTLGLRHAFDADHIAAVDNTTRKLLAENRTKPPSVGFWFSLGHSTVVFGLAFLLSIGVKALAGQVENNTSRLRSVAGIGGASVSGAFLLILGILNLVVLLGIIRVFRIYPIGLLFGLGFDTATEVGLLVLAGGAAAFNLPFYAILVRLTGGRSPNRSAGSSTTSPSRP